MQIIKTNLSSSPPSSASSPLQSFWRPSCKRKQYLLHPTPSALHRIAGCKRRYPSDAEASGSREARLHQDASQTSQAFVEHHVRQQQQGHREIYSKNDPPLVQAGVERIHRHALGRPRAGMGYPKVGDRHAWRPFVGAPPGGVRKTTGKGWRVVIYINNRRYVGPLRDVYTEAVNDLTRMRACEDKPNILRRIKTEAALIRAGERGQEEWRGTRSRGEGDYVCREDWR